MTGLRLTSKESSAGDRLRTDPHLRCCDASAAIELVLKDSTAIRLLSSCCGSLACEAVVAAHTKMTSAV